MKSELIRDLVCPTCKEELETHDFDAAISDGSGSEIETGALTCDTCRILYPVEYGVPVLLVFNRIFMPPLPPSHI